MTISFGSASPIPGLPSPIVSYQVASTAPLIYALVAGLAVVGLTLIGVGVHLLRATRADPDALGPLEVMGERSWWKSDTETRTQLLTAARPAGAQPRADADDADAADAAAAAPPAPPAPAPLPGQPPLAGVAASVVVQQAEADETGGLDRPPRPEDSGKPEGRPTDVEEPDEEDGDSEPASDTSVEPEVEGEPAEIGEDGEVGQQEEPAATQTEDGAALAPPTGAPADVETPAPVDRSHPRLDAAPSVGADEEPSVVAEPAPDASQ